jgi:hypothetical protein
MLTRNSISVVSFLNTAVRMSIFQKITYLPRISSDGVLLIQNSGLQAHNMGVRCSRKNPLVLSGVEFSWVQKKGQCL